MKTYTPKEACILLNQAEKSQGLYERPWLDDIVSQLLIHSINNSFSPEKFINDEKIQLIINKIDEKEYYKIPSTIPLRLKSGRRSKKWSKATREKKFGTSAAK